MKVRQLSHRYKQQGYRKNVKILQNITMKSEQAWQ